jgi:hypothetical protein
MLEIIGVVFGMAVLSFVFKPNPVHRLVESLYIGSAAGYLLVTNFNKAYKNAIVPLPSDPLLILPLILSLLVFMRLYKKYSWLSNYPLAFLTAIGVGISVRTIAETDILKQIRSTALPLLDSTSVIATFSNIVLLVSVVTVITYFLYATKPSNALNISSKAGISFMMIAFGASLANSLLSRVSRTIGFLQRLILVPSGTYMVPIMVIIIAIAAFPEKLGLKSKE